MRSTKIIFRLVTIVLILTACNNWKKDCEATYVGKYELVQYKNYSDCILELKKDNSYIVSNAIKEYESGSWKYFDDGDIHYVQFNNGRQLGDKEYKYKKK